MADYSGGLIFQVKNFHLEDTGTHELDPRYASMSVSYAKMRGHNFEREY